MFRAFLLYQNIRRLGSSGGMNRFLEGGLVIGAETGPGGSSGNFVELGSENGLENELTRCVHTAIEIKGGQNGFQGVHEQGGFVAAPAFFFSPAEAKKASEIELLRHLDEVALADQVGAQLG